MALTSKRRRNNNSLESFAKVLLSLSFLLIASVVLTPKDLRGYRQPGKRSRDSFDLLQLGSQQADFTNGDAVQDLELASVSSLNHRNYTFWSSDFHIGPIADLKDILSSSFGIRVIDKSLSAHCHLKNTCAKDLKVKRVICVYRLQDHAMTFDAECPDIIMHTQTPQNACHRSSTHKTASHWETVPTSCGRSFTTPT